MLPPRYKPREGVGETTLVGALLAVISTFALTLGSAVVFDYLDRQHKNRIEQVVNSPEVRYWTAMDRAGYTGRTEPGDRFILDNPPFSEKR